MRTATYCLLSLLSVGLLAHPAQSQGGFREVLEIVGIEPADLETINPGELTADDWQTISRIVSRLDQHDSDLDRWIMQDALTGETGVGNIIDLTGTVERVARVAAPAGETPPQLYRCDVKLADGHEATVLAVRVPKRWELDTSLNEPVSLRGVLLQGGESPSLVATHISWHPQKGLPAGKLLLARFGMDAGLWDHVIHRTALVSPERGHEAQAFYAVLEALAQVPAAEFAALVLQAIDESAASAKTESGDQQQRQIATAVIQQARKGLSSVAPLFLNPEKQAGRLVRIEGTARRAVRIVADDPSNKRTIRDYYELEVFTADSQNLPIVCLVTKLPPGFPVGDAIRAGVRVDGVFFKLWRYRSRSMQSAGETTTPRASYTPIVMAATVAWLKQSTTPERWWGLAVGGVIFVLVMGGLLRIGLASRSRIPPLKDEAPDFSRLEQ